MSRSTLVVAFVIGVLVQASPAFAGQAPGRSQAAAPARSPQAIASSRNAAICTAVGKKDVAAIASVYSKNAVSIDSDSGPTNGRDAIAQMWQANLDRGMASCEITTTDAVLAGGVLTDRGTFVMKAKDGSVIMRGTYTTEWKMEDGQWRIQKNSHTLAR